MKKILIPTDFSINAHEALFYTIKLFKNERCKFYILHSFEVENPIFTTKNSKKDGKIRYEEKLTEINTKLNEILVSISGISEGSEHIFETLAITKPLVESVQKTIQKLSIDLVVMGTKGASGIKEMFMGSNTVKVLKSIFDVPLLIVPTEINNFNFKNIAFATSFKNEYSERSLRYLKEFCKLYKCNLEIIHIDNLKEFTDNENKNRKVLEYNLENINYSINLITKNKSTEKDIRDYLSNITYDLLIMVNYKHDDLYNWMNESVVNKMGYHTKIPFLILPD
ncbi:universal stress protein [Tenacibaculum sp. ZS6-P6]|uniref:universal stress protein n=1 Tax=Tenacibaculum sp. ZS6-P6 TaxID=3447503 RepID=UPI003F9E79F8